MESFVKQFLDLRSTFILLQIWCFVSSCTANNDPRYYITVVWRVDVENSNLIIVPFSRINDQFVPENALVIWRGHIHGEICPERYLYYWLGERVQPRTAALTASLAMQAALKKCHGSPVIRREVNGYETDTFRSYFEDSMVWADHDTNPYANLTKLYHVKGKYRARIKQVPVEGKLLQGRSSLILLTEDEIFIHHGTRPSPSEVAVANKLVRFLATAGKIAKKNIHTFRQDRPTTNTKSLREFLSYLNISKRDYLNVIRTEQDDEDDKEDYEKIRDGEISTVIVYVNDAKNDELIPTVVNAKLNRPLETDILYPQFCLVIDTASEAGVFLWIGEKSETVSRIRAARAAEETIDEKHYPLHTPVTVVEDGAEPLEFMINFIDGLRHEPPSQPKLEHTNF